jgi:NAD(P)-dependent dehydrogenase (short-subunit alcohol dehydrogenase family)
MKLDGMNAIVTGASRGLGAALAEALARAGARVVLVARGRESLEALAASLRAEGLTVHALAEDVAEKQAVHRIAGAAAALTGPIDLLVNNASLLGPVPLAPLAETDCEDLEAALAANLVGPFRLTKAVIGSMLLRGRGVVLNVTSDAATSPYPGWGAYGASKAALEHLTAIWAAELAESGVKLFRVDPGEMDTQMHADALPDADRSALTRPDVVARRIVALVEQSDSLASGARFEAAAFAAAPW